MRSRLWSLTPPGVRGFFELLWLRRRPLALFIGTVAVVATGVSLLLPRWYAATATLLPPAEQNEAFGLTGMIQSAALNKVGLLSTATPSDVFAEILRSRTLHEELIRRFDLVTLYRSGNMDQALKDLGQHLRIDVNQAGLIVIRVEDQKPRRASDMANDLVAMLDRFNRETYVTKAKRTRQFLEARLSDVTARLALAESTLTAYEGRNKVLASNEDVAVRGIAGVIAQKLSLQVKRSYVSSYSQPNSPALREIDAEMAAFDRELGRLPGLKQEGSRLALEAEIQRKIFTLLTSQYEDARVQETRDTPTITVLDLARPPILRSRPHRSIVVLAATALASVLGAAWVAFELRTTRPA